MQTSQSPATKAFARTMVIANSQPLVRSNPSLGTDRSRMVASVDPCGPIDPFVHPRPLQHPHSSVGCHPHYGPLPPALSVPRGPSLPPPPWPYLFSPHRGAPGSLPRTRGNDRADSGRPGSLENWETLRPCGRKSAGQCVRGPALRGQRKTRVHRFL